MSWNRSRFNYGVEMNPGYVNMYFNKKRNMGVFPQLMKYSREIKRILHIRRSLLPQKYVKEVSKVDYDETWNNILSLRPLKNGIKMIPCAFTDWDNTPRHKERGCIYQGASPEKFRKYLSQLVKNTKK